MAWIASWLLPIMIGLEVFYLLLFPTGRLPSRRWRWLAWLTVAFVVVGVILSAFSAGALIGALVHHISASARRSGPLSVCATTPCRRSGAPADQMVCLQCCDIRYRRRPHRHHLSNRHTPLVRAGRTGIFHSRG